MLKQPPHDRHINWLFDPFGNTGKSTYAKYYVFKKSAQILSWAGSNQKNLFYARKINQHKPIIFFDFTRSIPYFVDQNELYSSIESIKNGLLFSAKYESGDVVIGKPHIVIFSNILPTNPSAISIDRWNIYRIGNKSKTLIPMDFYQCNDFIRDYKKYENIKEESETFGGEKENKKNMQNSIYKGYFKTSDLYDSNANIYSPDIQLLEIYGD